MIKTNVVRMAGFVKYFVLQSSPCFQSAGIRASGAVRPNVLVLLSLRRELYHGILKV